MIKESGKFFLFVCIGFALSTPMHLGATDTDNSESPQQPCHALFHQQMDDMVFRRQLVELLPNLETKAFNDLGKLVDRFLKPGENLHVKFIERWIELRTLDFADATKQYSLETLEEMTLSLISGMNNALLLRDPPGFDQKYVSFRAAQNLLSDIEQRKSPQVELTNIHEQSQLISQTRDQLSRTIRHLELKHSEYTLKRLQNAIDFLSKQNAIIHADYLFPNKIRARETLGQPYGHIKLESKIMGFINQRFKLLYDKKTKRDEANHIDLFENTVAAISFNEAAFGLLNTERNSFSKTLDQIVAGYLFLTAAYNTPVARSIAEQGLLTLKDSVLRQISDRKDNAEEHNRLRLRLAQIEDKLVFIHKEPDDQSSRWELAGDLPIYVLPVGLRGGVLRELDRLEKSGQTKALNNYRSSLLEYLQIRTY